jgi:hypothetical protein
MLAEVVWAMDLPRRFPQMSVFCTSAGPFKTGKGGLIQSRCQGLIDNRRPAPRRRLETTKTIDPLRKCLYRLVVLEGTKAAELRSLSPFRLISHTTCTRSDVRARVVPSSLFSSRCAGHT